MGTEAERHTVKHQGELGEPLRRREELWEPEESKTQVHSPQNRLIRTQWLTEIEVTISVLELAWV